MQYILSEQEMRRGCELVEASVTEKEPMSLECACMEQESLNSQGYFTILHCVDTDEDWYVIDTYIRKA